MRIAYVCADRGIPVLGENGASVHVREVLRAFATLGHDVHCLVARRGDGDGAGLKLEEVGQAGDDCAGGESAAEAIEARLCELHETWPFDLVYERYSLWSAAGCRAAARIAVPVITEVNALLLPEQANRRDRISEARARAIEAEVLTRSDLLVAVSEQLARYLEKAGASSDRIVVIGNAVDTRRFRPDIHRASIAGVPDKAFVIGFTGSLQMWHGVDTLLRAFRDLKETEARAHLLIVGEGPQRNWIEGFVDGTGLTGSVTLTGWVAHEDLPPVIARMDVATAPYPQSNASYLSPLKLFEYLAMGRPVVASRIGQIEELLRNSEAACLLPPGNAPALASVLRALMRCPTTLRRMANASAREGRRHDWTDNAQAVLQYVPTSRSVA